MNDDCILTTRRMHLAAVEKAVRHACNCDRFYGYNSMNTSLAVNSSTVRCTNVNCPLGKSNKAIPFSDSIEMPKVDGGSLKCKRVQARACFASLGNGLYAKSGQGMLEDMGCPLKSSKSQEVTNCVTILWYEFFILEIEKIGKLSIFQ